MSRRRRPLATAVGAAFGVALGLVAACDPDALPPAVGVDLPASSCGHGAYVIATDYQSTSVSILRWDGTVASAGILTSGSELPGLSAALSGDVVAPTERTRGGDVVLLDRYPASVLTLLDPRGPGVDAQVSVQTGFASNPQDFVEVGEGRAFVSRYERNLDAGRESFDAGSDLLIVDLAGPTITGRVDLASALTGEDPDILPRPSRMVGGEGGVVVLLSAYSASFTKSADARLVDLDPATGDVRATLRLAGMRGCSGLARSPSGGRLAVVCSGTFGGTSTPTLDDAGVVVVASSPGSLAETTRFGAAELGGDPLGFSASFASEDVLVFPTLGRLDDRGAPARQDRLVELDLASGAHRDLLLSAPEPFTLGDVRCEPACGACLVGDAGRGVVQRLPIEDGHAGAPAAIELDDGTGLPPRYVGAY